MRLRQYFGQPQGLPLHWVNSCRGWVSQPVGRGSLAPTIGHLSTNGGRTSHKCQHALERIDIYQEIWSQINADLAGQFPPHTQSR